MASAVNFHFNLQLFSAIISFPKTENVIMKNSRFQKQTAPENISEFRLKLELNPNLILIFNLSKK